MRCHIRVCNPITWNVITGYLRWSCVNNLQSGIPDRENEGRYETVGTVKHHEWRRLGGGYRELVEVKKGALFKGET
jgi:hypothetical protein